MPFAFLFTSGCATQATGRDGAPPAALTLAAAPPAAPYRIQVGDTVAVKFYFNTDLNETTTVRPDGMVSLQLIGDVLAAGQTPAQLTTTITERYTGELANPKVTVIVQTLGSRVYVGGEVGKQGPVPLTGGLSLFQAIQEAGGFTQTAQRSQVILIRRDEDGQVRGYEMDMRPVQNGVEPSADLPLQPYDIVFVPQSKIAEVNQFVDQYFNKVMPRPPFGFAIPIF